MGVWADLPAEIAILVLRALESTADEKEAAEKLDGATRFRVNQDLVNCTYVSRQFRAIVESLLYRDIWLPGNEKITEERPFLYRLFKLTRAIVMRPMLGKYVHKLSIPSMGHNLTYDYWDVDAIISKSNTNYGDLDEINESLFELGGAATGDLEHILKALPARGLRNGLIVRGGPCGVLIALFHFLPRLQSLTIDVGEQLEFIALSCFGAFVGGIPAGLTSVSELLVFHEEYEIRCGFHTEEVLPFMALPSLKSFAFDAHEADENDDVSEHLQLGIDIATTPFSILNALPSNGSINLPKFIETPDGYALPARSSSITTLHIGRAAVSCQLVNKILTIPSHLEKFENTTLDWGPSCHLFRPAQFLPGLLGHASTLRELVLDIDLMDSIDDDEPFIGSLSGLVALETLRISPRVLILSVAKNGGEKTTVARNPMDKLLPPNLTSLELFLKIKELPDLIERTGIPHSIRFTRHHIPSLISISLKGSSYYDYSDNDLVIGLAKQMPALQPPMKGSIFGVSYGD
ncbi:hypothetical protein DL93DRAFT_1835718 [Clavulina sp. PMI_390]|nr:hypothetical protein DL93DRAFT_1835718 [Clavulina sp. PMI_390]